MVAIRNGSTARLWVPAAPNYGGGLIALPKALRGDVDTAWNAECEDAGATVYVTLVGYTAVA